jgi:hypothetical protein
VSPCTDRNIGMVPHTEDLTGMRKKRAIGRVRLRTQATHSGRYRPPAANTRYPRVSQIPGIGRFSPTNHKKVKVVGSSKSQHDNRLVP